ncbi:MAG: hypothetical protein H0T62_12975 [Parachlamydiaceae bacterium]|nr:hypothetical protein [Parachlamydiaceae bacterium]
MDCPINNITNKDEIITFPKKAKEQIFSEEKLKIQYIVANIFIDIANFFKRILCCSEPFALYTAENCQSRVIELTLTPDSDEEEFFNEYENTHKSEKEDLDDLEIKSESDDEEIKVSKSDDEVNDVIQSGIEGNNYHSAGVIVCAVRIMDAFKDLLSHNMVTEEMSSRFKSIATQEDALEFTVLCISQYPSIKEVFENSYKEYQKVHRSGNVDLSSLPEQDSSNNL